MRKLYYETKPGELQHGLFGTTNQKKNAKYIARIRMPNGKYRYFYTKGELDRYNAVKKATSAVKKGVGAINEGISDALGKRYYDKAEEYEKKKNSTGWSRELIEEKARSRDKINKEASMLRQARLDAVKNSKNKKEYEKNLKAFKEANEQYNKVPDKYSLPKDDKNLFDFLDYERLAETNRDLGDKSIYGMIQEYKKRRKAKKNRQKSEKTKEKRISKVRNEAYNRNVKR